MNPGNQNRAPHHFGTSGWHYKHWQGNFYPETVSAEKWLSYYAGVFDTVEINNSFYRLPAADTLTDWGAQVPEGFLFAVKAGRYITHMKKLKDSREPVETLFERIDGLGHKLGPVLFQLPPRWRYNAERLEQFLASLPAGYQYAFEFRDHSWQNQDAYTILKKFNAAFCMYHLDGFVSPKVITADFIYIRLHGPEGPYQGDYDVSTLSGWAGAISSWTAEGREVFVYFDNDQAGFAPENAGALKAML